jgi:cobalt-zinc-cadmium efflux system protein
LRASLKKASLALLLVSLGAVLKIYGGVVYGSKAVFVDGLTSIASVLAGVSLVWWLLKSLEPPDEDHPYGHERLVYGGSIYTVGIYGIVAGYALSRLTIIEAYEISSKASLLALTGTIAYTLAIIIYHKIGRVGAQVAAFTLSEILEGVVSSTTSFLGSLRGCWIDYIGAWVIEIYLLAEVFIQAKNIIKDLSDVLKPENIKEDVKKRFEERGFKVLRLRMRTIIPNKYQGDAIVKPPCNLSYKEADNVIDDLVKKLSTEGIDLVVHIESQKNESCS